MNDRQLIADLLSALEYHEQQTRPIYSTTVAIQAAEKYLRSAPQRKPLTDEEIEAIRQADDCGEDVPEFTRIFRIAERAHGIGGEA